MSSLILFFDWHPLLNWYGDALQGCEREAADAEKGSSDELLKESILRLSWALVHSRQPEDVQRGIAMLEGEVFQGIRHPFFIIIIFL